MWKVAKYKILTLLDDRLFKAIVVIFFVVLNYTVFIKSGILSDGNQDFNKILKYTLLINNFNITSTIFGQLIAIYIGNGLISNDIASGKLYIMIISYPKRWKYLLGDFLGLILIVVAFVLLVLVNYLVCSFVLSIYISYSDLLHCFIYIFFNMIVIMTITAVSSIFILGKASLVVGLIGMGIFSTYTYQSIPLLNYPVNLSIGIRRILACLAPISNVAATPSIYSDGSLARYIVIPYLFNNMVVYQIVFVFIILIIGIISFRLKEL